MTALLAVVLGGLAFCWPAFLNGYPIVFSDTAAFLHQTLGPLMIWDKPWIYGPMMHLLHWRVSLWPVVLAQGVMVSALLWLLQRVMRGQAGLLRHLALCLGLAVLTALPFTSSLLMPDILAPVVILGAFLLGPGWGGLRRWEGPALGLLMALAIAAHLSHLPVAAGLAVIAGLLALPAGWRPALRSAGRVALPLAGALALLLATNLAGHGRLAVSPYGDTFLLARLVADGPAARTIAAECPGRGWYLCAWAGRLPADSDDFLWSPASPVNRDQAGASRFLGGRLLAPEAGAIIAATLRREPGAVLAGTLRNTVEQLAMAQAGEALSAESIGKGPRERIAESFPARELAWFEAGEQVNGRLFWRVAGLTLLQALVLWAAVALAAVALWRSRRDPLRLGLLVIVLAGLVGNAAATGGLSGPHPRYQSRVAWLLPLVGVVCWRRARLEEGVAFPQTPIHQGGKGLPGPADSLV